MSKPSKTTTRKTRAKSAPKANKKPGKNLPQRNRKADVLRWGSKLLGITVILSYCLAVYAINTTGVVPARYVVTLLPLGLIATLIVGVSLIRNKPRRGARTAVLMALSVLIIFLSGYAFKLGRSTTAFLETIESTSKQNTGTVITKPYIVYISGIDTYGDVGRVARSDVNILAVVNPQTKKVLLVNTPRDYYVQLRGTTGVRDKLTHAGIYGVERSKGTLEDLYGTPINYTVRINFTSLLKMVDAVGGVDVFSDYAFSAGGYEFIQGTNTLNAKQALAFARERKSFTEGDRMRGQNQQRVIEALIAKPGEPSTLVNYQQILSSLEGTFQTNASSSEIGDIIKQQLGGIGAWRTESISVDGTGSSNVTFSMGNQLLYVMEPDISTVNAAKAKIQDYLRS